MDNHDHADKHAIHTGRNEIMEVNAFMLYRQKRQNERRAMQVSRSSAVVNIKLDALKKLAQALLLEVSSLEQQKGDTGRTNLDLSEEVHEFEADLIRCALVKTDGHQAQAARLLNIKPTTLHEKMKRYAIQQFESQKPETDEPADADDENETISDGSDRTISRGTDRDG
jgi:DNA-binding NtrC family response regulator